VSSPRDLKRWVDALRSGELLSPESSRRMLAGTLLEGGNDRGFLCAFTEDPGAQFFLCSASHAGMADDSKLLADALWQLMTETLNPFSLGVMFGVERNPDGLSVVVDDVVHGGAAQAGGLRPGDVVVEVQGKHLESVEEQLRGLGKRGDPVIFGVLRDGRRVEVVVKPRRR